MKDRLDSIKTKEGQIQDGRFYIFKFGDKYTPAFYQRRIDPKDGIPKEGIEYLDPVSKTKAVQAYYEMINHNRFPVSNLFLNDYDRKHGNKPYSEVPIFQIDEIIKKDDIENEEKLRKLLEWAKHKTTQIVYRPGFNKQSVADTSMISKIRPARQRRLSI